MTLRVFDRHDAEYPKTLLELASPPQTLYLEGTLPTGPSVAIVGARRATERGRCFARTLGRTLASHGVVIVSGGALGIDAEAHLGALEGGGTTVVVLPTPVDKPGPASNRPIFDRIVASGGAMVSEYGERLPGRAPFRDRNRLIAALASMTIVVEAWPKSGTLYTVRAARRLGRRIGAVPWAPDEPQGYGCMEVLRRGGILIEGPKTVLKTLRIPTRRAKPVVSHPVAELLGAQGALRSDEIAEALRIPLFELQATLTVLEIDGLLSRRPGGRYALVRQLELT